MSYGDYHSNGSGKGASGWRFEFDGEYHFTHGQKPHKFMQTAIIRYQEEGDKIFEKAFKQVYGRALK